MKPRYSRSITMAILMSPSRWRTGFNCGNSATKIFHLARTKFPGVEIHFPQRRFQENAALAVPGPTGALGFLFQDSMHFMSGILSEWEIMKPFARSGSVVVFDDVVSRLEKMPRHLLKQDDFCGRFLLKEAWKNGWLFKSTAEGRAQFWAQKRGRKQPLPQV